MIQLPLNVALHTTSSFENFYTTEANTELVNLLSEVSQPRFNQLLIWGEHASGKSHLLQAYCNKALGAQKAVFYVPLKTFAPYGSGVLVGMERFDTLVIDDFDLVLGDVTWEEMLYGLINERHDRNQQLILSTARAPRQLVCELDDLVQRFKWGLTYELHSLQETQMLEALKWGAEQRGFELTDTVLDLIARRYPHNMTCLSAVLEYLDRRSLRDGRKITRPFAQQVLQDFHC